ncbi:MAG: hypothetical protein HRK26_00545 [Rickettsiaceae bacterium H1]|nr:hypothetical protein [Rickettsiaceae bacterium H1]
MFDIKHKKAHRKNYLQNFGMKYLKLVNISSMQIIPEYFFEDERIKMQIFHVIFMAVILSGITYGIFFTGKNFDKVFYAEIPNKLAIALTILPA